jgi:hypothetical protein
MKEPAYSNLENAFPIGLQGSSVVILPASEAAKIFELSGRKRHFTEDDELVRLPGKGAAVSNQWGELQHYSFSESRKAARA